MERDYLVQNPRKRLNPPDTLDAGGLLPPGYGIPMNNPYEIHIMQRAIDSLCIEHNLGPIILLPTDVYVRFLPKDSLEYNALLSLDTELFDYPLTYEFPEGMDSFRDPSVPDTLITWQYTVVPYRTILPDIQYEVLDTCYIPPEEPDRSLPSDFYYRLEMLADSLANPTLAAFQRFSPPSRAGVYPSGTVMMESDTSSIDNPVRGVHVRAHRFVKIGVGYTDDTGCYVLDTKFNKQPCYSIFYQNIRGFALYGSYMSVTPTWYSAGRHSASGYNIRIPTSSNIDWYTARLNNLICEFIGEYVLEGMTPPPSDMRIDLINVNSGWSGGTPMLRQMGSTAVPSFCTLEALLGAWIPPSLLPGCMFKYMLPDIIISENLTTEKLSACVYHELSHASHYVKAGGFCYWSDVIYHFARSKHNNLGLYGDGTIGDSRENEVELTEAWAYANERMLQWKMYHVVDSVKAGRSKWFNPAITAIYNVFQSGILSPAQVLDQMSSSVKSIDDLRSRLMMEYTSERYQIGRIFSEEGALSAQTRWRIINKSYTTLSVARRWGNVIDSVNVSHLDTAMFSAMPTGYSSFYSLQNSYYYPDEITIRRLYDSGVVFHQLNKVTTVPMHHPFFNSAEWDEVDKYFSIGHTSIRDYDYTISSSDIY